MKEECGMKDDIAQAVKWLKGIAHEGARLRLDSRTVRPGDVFVAVPGAKVDGRAFIRVAAARGASGVLLEARDTSGEHYPVASRAVKDLKSHLGEIASAFYGDPSSGMRGIAVTGTNGKTTTAFWVSQLFGALGEACGVIGTVGTFFGEKTLDAPDLTTPDALSLQGIYADFKREGVKAFAVEASSVGLEQGRMAGSHFKVGIFTNLSRDHLDYHKTMASYEDAKGILFTWPGLEAAVLNADDPVSEHFSEIAAKNPGVVIWATGTNGRAEKFVKDGRAAHAVEARDICMAQAGVRFTLVFDGKTAEIDFPQIGAFNVLNVLGVVAAALASGFAFEDVAKHLPTLRCPPGRLEMLSSSDAPLCVVDFAHTPDSLQKALESLRPTAKARGGRLWVVFGCGGDRDAGKRPLMGGIAGRLADLVIVTSDNPRTEEPEAIAADIAAGFQGENVVSRDIRTVLDRREAIYEAVLEAAPEDVVLVAGKGHETEQITKEGTHHFSDQEVVREAFNERRVCARK